MFLDILAAVGDVLPVPLTRPPLERTRPAVDSRSHHPTTVAALLPGTVTDGDPQIPARFGHPEIECFAQFFGGDVHRHFRSLSLAPSRGGWFIARSVALDVSTIPRRLIVSIQNQKDFDFPYEKFRFRGRGRMRKLPVRGCGRGVVFKFFHFCFAFARICGYISGMKRKRKQTRDQSPLTIYRVHRLRKTLADLVEPSGVSLATLCGLEHGRLPLPKRWRDIAGAYQLTERRMLAMVEGAGRREGNLNWRAIQ